MQVLEGTDERVKLQRNALKVLEAPAGADVVSTCPLALVLFPLYGFEPSLCSVKVPFRPAS